jgi:hypothetical protein
MLAATVGPATVLLPGRRCVRDISFSSAPPTVHLLVFIANSKDLCVKQKLYFNKDRSQLINIMASVLFGTLSFVGIHMGEVQTRTFQRDFTLTLQADIQNVPVSHVHHDLPLGSDCTSCPPSDA